MAELSTVARPYAEAIFAVARDDKAGLASWADQIQRLAEVFDVDAVRVAMSDPRLDDQQRTSVFLGLVQPPVDKTLTTFVELLVANDRLILLPQIAEQFQALRDAAEGVAQANITSAFPMSDEQVTQLLQLHGMQQQGFLLGVNLGKFPAQFCTACNGLPEHSLEILGRALV